MTQKTKRPDTELSGIHRRDFLEYCGGLAALLSLPGCGSTGPVSASEVRDVLEQAAVAPKPPVIWLEGQDCAGCSIAFLDTDPPVADVLIKSISLRYHETLMAASGDVANQSLDDAVAAGGHILVVEGAIPLADDRFCTVGGKSFRQNLLDCAKGAKAIIAVGACASYGGIPRLSPSKGRGVSSVITTQPVINLPMCPAHPEHVLGTIVYLLQNQSAPPLDSNRRPLMFFNATVHSQCERRRNFTLQKFLTDWNDPKQAKYCLYKKGCQGRTTYSDCPTRRFNGKTNHCIAAGAVCNGCAQPAFFATEEPLFGALDADQDDQIKWGLA